MSDDANHNGFPLHIGRDGRGYWSKEEFDNRDKPAATGSEPDTLRWLRNNERVTHLPTPPASPTVTLDRETLVTLLEIVPQFPPSTRYGKAFEDALALLRAAEGRD
jgi:hypothetical protein